jgi:putative DNA primase/helicase
MSQTLSRVRLTSNRTDSATEIDDDEAQRFLTLLDPDAESFTFQTFDDNKNRRDKTLTRVLHGTLAEHRDELTELNERGAGIFVSLNETDGTGRKAENITRVRAVSVDLDGAPLDPVHECLLEPHIEVESSPGKYHCYWFVDGLKRDDFQSVQWTVASHFDGDPAVGKLTLVARLPGFFHNKKQPFRTRILKTRDHNRFTDRELTDTFIPSREPHKAPSSQPMLNPAVPVDSAREFIKRGYTPDDEKPELYTLRHYRGRYYRWTGTHYEAVDDGRITRELYGFLQNAIVSKRVARSRYREFTFEPFNPTRPKVGLIEHALRPMVHLEPHVNQPFFIMPDGEEPLPAPDIIACKNGLLDIARLKLKPHRPDFFNVNSLPFDYDPDAPSPERWLQFIREVWPDDKECRRTLAEIMGLLLTGDTSFHKIFMLVGPPRSGKGTIGRIMDALYGNTNVVNPTLANIGSQFGLATLIDKSVAIISDARVGRADSNVLAERLLSISGEDKQSIDVKYEKHWAGKLNTRFVVMTNELPRINDASGALASRFIVLTMQKTFLGREDLRLMDKLLRELPGILNWALAGLDRLQQRGHFVMPESSRQAIELLEDLASPVGAFIRDWCVVGPNETVGVRTLFDAYCKWCDREGHKASSDIAFGRSLRGIIATINWQGRGRDRKYVGIGLNEDE